MSIFLPALLRFVLSFMKIGKGSRYLASELDKSKVDKMMKYQHIITSGHLKPAEEVYPK